MSQNFVTLRRYFRMILLAAVIGFTGVIGEAGKHRRSPKRWARCQDQPLALNPMLTYGGMCVLATPDRPR